jgi:hypothetical protein
LASLLLLLLLLQVHEQDCHAAAVVMTAPACWPICHTAADEAPAPAAAAAAALLHLGSQQQRWPGWG